MIWELRTETHHYDEYIILIIYLPDNNDWLAIIIKEMHIINNLKAKMLIDINILISKNISIMLLSRKAIVSSCDNIELSLTVITQLINSVWKAIMTHKNMIIQLRSHTNVLIVKTALPQNCDLLFKSDCHTENTAIYVYIVDYTLLTVQVQNDSDVSLVISWKTCLSHIVKYEVNKYYLVNSQNLKLAAFTIRKWANWIRTCF